MAATLFESPPSLRLISFPRIENVQNSTYKNVNFVDETDNQDYRHESSRLRSFRNWPLLYMEPVRLAVAGFYFTGEADIVKCFECSIEIYKWQKGDDPRVDHARESPECRFIRNIPCGNVPIVIDALDNIPPSIEDRDVCGLYDADVRLYGGSPEPRNSSPTNLPAAKAKYPEYESYDARFRSFELWPNLVLSKKELADAGFYYTGRGDQVLCFHCGVGVKDWDLDDDPWEQHAIWFSHCSYLLAVKGEEYVKAVTGQSISRDVASHIAKEVESVGTVSKETVEDECRPGSSSPRSACSPDRSTGGMSDDDSSVQRNNEDLSEACSSTTPYDDARMCKICFNAELCQLFLPCGHVLACDECANYVKTCPICRILVTKKVHIFLT